MSRKSQNLIRKSFLVHNVQQEMLDKLLDRWGFINESEIIRQAITYFYLKYEPEYLKPSPGQEEKIKQAKEREKIDAMTDEEYATDIIHGLVFKSGSGAKFCVTHFYANDIKVLPLEEVKDYYVQFPADLEFHLAKLSEKPLLPLLKTNLFSSMLKQSFDIVV